MHLLEIAFLAFVLLMVVQGIVNIFLNMFIWEDPTRIEKTASPAVFLTPRISFSVLLPARHEQDVIADTIKKISLANYPERLLEILVICEHQDQETINEAEKALAESRHVRGRVVIFNDGPINKPHGLNKGLEAATNDCIVIFDAEDEVHADIFHIANTLYQKTNADIIQAGVQLMNVKSSWYSIHNVLEYYFWFKSRMHFHTEAGMVPLGGNTVFFKTKDLHLMGGWDETCLTEDAEIGIRMSVAGYRTISTYDPKHVTKEETPHSVEQFIKQRTRWNQGFIQVLRRGHWYHYNSFIKRALCFYTLSFPIFQALLFLVTPLIIYVGLTTDLPFLLSMVSFLPLLLFFTQAVMYAVGLEEFLREQRIVHTPWLYVVMFAGFLPYQVLLSLGAIRGTVRELFGVNNWEKTTHKGLHRPTTAKGLGEVKL